MRTILGMKILVLARVPRKRLGTRANTELLMPKIFLMLSIYITLNYIFILAAKYILLAVYLGLGSTLT